MENQYRLPRGYIFDHLGEKMRLKHCYVDLASRYEFWLAIIYIDLRVILDLSTANQFFLYY